MISQEFYADRITRELRADLELSECPDESPSSVKPKPNLSGCCMTKSIQELRELTERLPEFPQETGPNMAGWKEHKMLQGTSLAQNVLNIPQISVARWFNSKDTEFPYHHHMQKEWILVISGSLTLIIAATDDVDGTEEHKHMEWGDYAFIEPEVIHKVVFDEDCWYLAITIPRSADWPTE